MHYTVFLWPVSIVVRKKVSDTVKRHKVRNCRLTTITAEDKKRDLYLRQKELLATLLEHGAISQAQHDKSLRDLTEKMGMQPSNEPND